MGPFATDKVVLFNKPIRLGFSIVAELRQLHISCLTVSKPVETWFPRFTSILCQVSLVFPFFLFLSPVTPYHTKLSVIKILMEESKLSSLQGRKKKGSCFLKPFPQLPSSSTIYFISLPCKQLQCLGAWAKPSPFVPCSHRCIFKGKLIPRNAVHAHTYLGAAPTPAHQVTQRPLALTATFQPAELLLANCYLSNR